MENKTSTFNASAAMILLSALTLGGCGGRAPTNTQANASDAAPVRATLLEPGRWELSVSLDRDYVRPFGSAPADPGGEPQRLALARTMTVCVTPEIAANPGPVLITASDAIDACQRNSWRMKGGVIDGDLTCAGRTGTVPLRITGSYSRAQFESESTEGSLGFTYREKVAAKRLGDCRAGDPPTWTPRSFSTGG